MADMDTPDEHTPVRIPIVEERLSVHKERVETGRVRIEATVETDQVHVTDTLTSDTVRIERVPIDRLVDDPPAIRTEGDRTIIPVIEEVLVRRIRVVEEVHVIRELASAPFEEDIDLRRRVVTVDRTSMEASDPDQ